MKVLIY